MKFKKFDKKLEKLDQKLYRKFTSEKIDVINDIVRYSIATIISLIACLSVTFTSVYLEQNTDVLGHPKTVKVEPHLENTVATVTTTTTAANGRMTVGTASVPTVEVVDEDIVGVTDGQFLIDILIMIAVIILGFTTVCLAVVVLIKLNRLRWLNKYR